MAPTTAGWGGDVVVAAPSENVSGAGTSIGALDAGSAPLRRDDFDGIEAYAVEGPPGLAVMAAALGAFGDKPDVVVSGPNAGLNTGKVRGTRWAKIDEFGHFNMASQSQGGTILDLGVRDRTTGTDPDTDTALCLDGYVTLTLLSPLEATAAHDVRVDQCGSTPGGSSSGRREHVSSSIPCAVEDPRNRPDCGAHLRILWGARMWVGRRHALQTLEPVGHLHTAVSVQVLTQPRELVGLLVLGMGQHVVAQLTKAGEELLTRRIDLLHLGHQALGLVLLLEHRVRDLLAPWDVVACGGVHDGLLSGLVSRQLADDVPEQITTPFGGCRVELSEQRPDLVVVVGQPIDDVLLSHDVLS